MKLIRATGCFTASQELIDYYSSGDLSKIDLDEDIKNYFNKDSKYIKSLINIENNLVYRDIEELFYDEEKEGEIFDKEKDIKKNIKIYLSHFEIIAYIFYYFYFWMDFLPLMYI